MTEGRSTADALRAVEAEIRRHPGHFLMQARDDLIRTIEAWEGFSLALSTLLHQCESDEPVMLVLMRNVGGDSAQRASIIRALDQATIAYAAALGAVIDHSRNLAKTQSEEFRERYGGRIARLQRDQPAALFLAKLRNYVLHYVAAPWAFEYSWGEGTPSRGSVFMTVEDLLRADWTKGVRDFLNAQEDRVQLSRFLQPYLEAMHEVMEWFVQEIWDLNQPAVIECNGLIAKRNLILTGGVSDGSDWHLRTAHMEGNLRRMRGGEPQLDYQSGEEISP